MTSPSPAAAPAPRPHPAAGPDVGLPLSVWVTAQQDARTQRHPALAPPAIESAAITR